MAGAVATPICATGCPESRRTYSPTGSASLTEQDPTDAVRNHWLAWAIELMLDDREPERPPVTIELRTGDRPIVIETRDGPIHIRFGPAENPDATLTGAPRPILGLLLAMIEPDDAKANGISYEGDPETLGRIRGLKSPAP